MKIALTSVHVDDPIKAHKFYTEVLGFTSQMFMPEHFIAIVVSPEDPTGTALLLEPGDHPVAKAYTTGLYAENLPVITFGTTDIQKDYERLKAAGVVFRGQPTKTDFGMEVNFEDTCGNLIQLAQV